MATPHPHPAVAGRDVLHQIINLLVAENFYRRSGAAALPRLATATTILLLEMLHKIGDYSQNSFSLNLCNQDSSHTGTLTHSLTLSRHG